MREDLLMQKANAVKERYENWLLSLPGVVGVMLSTRDRMTGAAEAGAEPVIKIMVSSLKDLKTGAIPSELEGVRVEVEVTGKFRPM